MNLDWLIKFDLRSLILGCLSITLINAVMGFIQTSNTSLINEIILFTLIFFLNFKFVEKILIPAFHKLSERSNFLLVIFIIVGSPFFTFFGFTYFISSKIDNFIFLKSKDSK